jgi:hypothetical protein
VRTRARAEIFLDVKENVVKREATRKGAIHPVGIFIVAHIAAVGIMGFAASALGDAYAPDNQSAASYFRLVPLDDGTGRIATSQPK